MGPEILYPALVAGGFLAGFVDAIAGGGGLITLPLLIVAVGNPVGAIASNKIVGTIGALCALWVYRRAGHLDWRKGVRFTAWVVVGSLCGSSLTPWIPTQVLRWAVVLICPVILWLVWKKDSLIGEILPAGHRPRVSHSKLACVGIACGFYDGAFGPGGGTFMFLALLGVVKLPLLAAMAVTKLSNSFSAGTALLRFSISGHVDWLMGGIVASGMAVGSVFGARHATAQAARVVKPVLTLVVVLLVLKMVME
jgi:uncharacterized protein